jgi:hypothetical protein
MSEKLFENKIGNWQKISGGIAASLESCSSCSELLVRTEEFSYSR